MTVYNVRLWEQYKSDVYMYRLERKMANAFFLIAYGRSD